MTVTNASRRARGLRRIEVWLPPEYVAKLDAICSDSGYSRTDLLLGMIDADYDSMLDAQTPKAPGRSRGRRKS